MNDQPRRPVAVWIIFVWVVFSAVASLISSYQFASSSAQLPPDIEMRFGTAQYIQGIGLQLLAIVAAILLILRIPASRWGFAFVLGASTLAWAFIFLGGLPEQQLVSSIVAAVISLGISALITWYTFGLVSKGYYNGLKTMPELPPRRSTVRREFFIAAAAFSAVLLIAFLFNFFIKRNNSIYIPGIVFAVSNLALLYWHSRHQHMTWVHRVCISIAIGFPVFFVVYSAEWPHGAGQIVFWFLVIALPVILAAVFAFKATDDFLGFSPSPVLLAIGIVLAVACLLLNATELLDSALIAAQNLRSMRQLANIHGTIYAVTTVVWAMLIFSGLKHADRQNVPATS